MDDIVHVYSLQCMCRYDYDLNIDANLNVLALLEPIAEKLETMTPEEKSAFRLEPGLGGQSVTIYERIIKKIYEEDRGLEVIEMLYSNPARVVPILLRRLTQKDEEWRKAQVIVLDVNGMMDAHMDCI